MGMSIGPRHGENTLVIGDAGGMINPFNGEGIAYGYESGRLAAAALGEALLAEDSTLLALYDERVEAAYGDYYKVARGFVRLISEPKVLATLVGVGMRIRPLMEELLAIMANLMRNDQKGPAEVGYRAVQRLASAIPDQAWDLLFNETAGASGA